MTAKKPEPIYEVRSVENPYFGQNDRPKYWYYLHGPGGPGPHGVIMCPELYFNSHEEAERAIPMATAAYSRGYSKHRQETGDMFRSLMGM